MRSLLLTSIFVLAAAASAAAQCTPAWSSSTTAAYAQGSAPTLPAAGGTFCDPVFGTEILRVTDASTQGGINFRTAYSYWSTFNSNNTRLLALNSTTAGARIFTFDPNGFSISGSFEAPSGVTSYETKAVWSRTNPNLMYGVEGLSIRVLDVSAGTPAWSTIATYTAGELGITGAAQFQQIHISDDDNTLSAHVQNSGYSTIGIAAVRINASKSVYYAETTSTVDEVQIDKSGRWLVHKTGVQGSGLIEVRVIDTTTDTVESLIDDSPDQAPGHSDNGNGIICGHANYLDAYTCRSLSSPHSYTTIIQDGTYSWLQSQHFSLLLNNENWLLVSQFGGVSTARFNNEIYFIQTQASGGVRRFVKHYSNDTDYASLPKANVSKDGKFVAYSSTYNPSGGRIDLFIAKVPSGMGIWTDTATCTVRYFGGLPSNQCGID